MGKCSPRCIYVSFSLLIFFGCVIIAAGFLFPWFVNTQLQNGLKSMLVVDSFDAPNYETWVNSTTSNTPPYYERFYLYNVTNHEAVERGEEKPNLVQVGPYSWLKKQIKFNVSFPDNGNQAKYKTWTYYTFDPSTSVGDPYTDRITTLNIPFQAVRANLGKNWWQSLAFDAMASATNSSMFVTLAPSELCWGGYQYPILEFISKLQPGTPTTFALLPNYTSIENADNLTSFDTFLTGKSDINHIQTYVEWQQNASLTVWGSEQCNEIKGTDGTQFHPGVDPSETLTLFIDTVFRTGYLVGNGTTTIEGIDLLRFDIVATQLMNATLYPPNAGFYMWLPTGLANLSVVSNGAPVFLSKPHFLDADPSYLEAVNGLSPNRSEHDTTLFVEPISGLTMSAYKRLQINVYVDSLLMLYENVSSIYFPIGWIEETSTITPELANKFKSSVYGALNMSRISKYVGWIAGPVFVVVGIVGIVSYRLRQKKSYVDYYKINQDDD